MPKVLFGVSYMGSKAKIALDILKQLPKGKRFVDLFGGGFAMSHAALLTNRYEKILYNDINPLITDLVKRAINGEFNYKIFKPKWITRQEFDLNKDKDGYIKYCWSFGNDGKGYLYGKNIDSLKEAQHNFIVFGKHSSILNKNYPEIYNFVTANDIHNRMLQTKHFFKKIYKLRSECPHLEKIARCPHLERIARCAQLERIDTNEKLEISNINYTDYKYQEGDIVYLDPPYEGTADYGNVFDSKQFYDWCISRPYQVWFSSYKISDKRFRLVYARELFNSLNSDNVCFNFECLYTNK